MIYRLLKLEEVLCYTGLSRSEIYRQIQEGMFPRPVRVGKRAVRWRESEVEGWIEERPHTVLQ